MGRGCLGTLMRVERMSVAMTTQTSSRNETRQVRYVVRKPQMSGPSAAPIAAMAPTAANAETRGLPAG